MKKLLLILLCVPLLFSCGEESKDINIEEDKSNTEQSGLHTGLQKKKPLQSLDYKGFL